MWWVSSQQNQWTKHCSSSPSFSWRMRHCQTRLPFLPQTCVASSNCVWSPHTSYSMNKWKEQQWGPVVTRSSQPLLGGIWEAGAGDIPSETQLLEATTVKQVETNLLKPPTINIHQQPRLWPLYQPRVVPPTLTPLPLYTTTAHLL